MEASLAAFASLAALSLFSGVLTTVAGMGGGLFLVLALGLAAGPLAALAITSPALLLSNAHRALLFRADLDLRVAMRFALGAVPAALLGALVAAKLPVWLVQCAMLCLALFAGARSLGIVRYAPSDRVVFPLSALIGVLAAAAGGAGFLAGPLLIALGLSGSRYIATVALCAVLLHAARVVGYRAGGILTAEHAAASLALFVGLVAGNFAGRRLRGKLTPLLEQRIEVGAIAIATALGLMGIGMR